VSYETARSKIVDLIEAATPTFLGLGLGARYRHDPQASRERPAPPRSFYLFGLEDAVATPLSRTRRRACVIEIGMFYRSAADRAQFDLALRADHKVVGDALLDASTWAASTSGIISIADQGQAQILVATIEQSDDVIIHAYRFTLEYVS
jgi:hypothetical protein